MSETYEEKMERLKGQLNTSFGLSNPGFWDNVAKTRSGPQLDRIFQLVRAAEQKAQDLEKDRDLRVREETERIVHQRADQNPGPVSGWLAAAISYPISPQREAEQNVSAELAREKRQITEEVTQNINAELRLGEEHARLKISQEDLSAAMSAFVQDLKQINGERDRAEHQLHQLFVRHHREMVEIASERGEQDPQRSVSQAFSEVRGLIDHHHENRLTRAYSLHGQDQNRSDIRQDATEQVNSIQKQARGNQQHELAVEQDQTEGVRQALESTERHGTDQTQEMVGHERSEDQSNGQ